MLAGTTTKKEVTGSVASLKSGDFDMGSYTDPAGLMQGKVAGLSITNPSGGNPNGSFEINVLGSNTKRNRGEEFEPGGFAD